MSIIIPAYNEAGNIVPSVKETVAWARGTGKSFEVWVVDDGSADATAVEAAAVAKEEPSVHVVSLMRNFGQTQAYQAGLDRARGRYVLLRSADRETAVEVLGEVLAALESGADFVNTARVARWEGARRRKSRWANAVLNSISGLRIVDRGSGTKGMVGPLAKAVRLQGEWHRFLPDLASLFTDRIVEIECEFKDRVVGQSAYAGRMRSLPVVLDLLTLGFLLSMQKKPFRLIPGRLFGFSGLVLLAVGGGIALYLMVGRIFFHVPLSDRPLFLLSVLIALLGGVMVMFGMLGELLLRIFFQTGGAAYIARHVDSHRNS